MRIAMAQMKMDNSTEHNLNKTIAFMRGAMRKGVDLIIFPELQLSPFFPKYSNQNVSSFLMTLQSPEIKTICETCRKMSIYASPNVQKNFYEQDYYSPSDDGFKVFNTPFGKVGIVICFDRHIPLSIYSCAKQGAQLILIPTANLTSENIELYEWEIRVQAYQSTSYIAMCNRTGIEDKLTFSGQSVIVSPEGEMMYKATENEQLIVADIPLEKTCEIRKNRPWLDL